MDSSEEVWAVVAKYPRYSVSTHGRVRNDRNGHVLRQGLVSGGYYGVTLMDCDGQHSVTVHRLVALALVPNPDRKTHVDHMNGVRTDNRVQNLRWASVAENSRNRRSRQGSSSQYKGVNRDNVRNKWKASIKVRGRTLHLGYFDNEEEAGRAYDCAARLHHKEYAKLNFPDA